MTTVYTIGYATKAIDVFIEQLSLYSINVIADVRSVPYSKVFFDYHKEAIAQTLKQNSIQYVYLGEELGPRSKNKQHYDSHGQVQFDRLMRSTIFEQGIKRLKLGVERGYNIALMCAEKDAATCHRSLLIGYYITRLSAAGNNKQWEIKHISHEGTLETQGDLEKRIRSLNSQSADLFMSEKELNKQSYDIQLKKTSYIKPHS